MNNFKQTVHFRVIRSILAAVGAVAVFFIIYFITGGMASVAGGSGPVDDFVQGFDLGIFSAVVVVSIFGAVSNALTLRSEEKMKKLYIKETDERQALIKQKSGSTAFYIILYSLILATIASGFLNTTVFFTLLAAVIFSEITLLSTIFYYKHKLS